MFFKKRKLKNVRFADVDSMVIVTKGMHFEFLPREQVVKYRNVISPKDGGISFPEGYFDIKESHIPNDTMSLILTAFEQLFPKLTLEDDLDILPDGAVRDVYMEFSLLGNKVYYSNTHAVKDGFFVETEPVDVNFKQIIQLLKQHCSFPEYIPQGYFERDKKMTTRRCTKRAFL